MKSEEALASKSHLLLRLGSSKQGRWVAIDLAPILASHFGMSNSEVKRVVDQGGLTVYLRDDVKVKYEK